MGRHRLGPEHVPNLTPETWPHSNTMRASGARALGGMFCTARITHGQAMHKDKEPKAEALEVLGQKPFALQVTHSYTGSNVNLHEWRQLEIVAWTDRSMAYKKTGRQTDRT